MTPNAYRLGSTAWTLLLGCTDVYHCCDIDGGGCHLTSKELELMGAVPVESKQVEKIERIKKALDIVQADTEYNLNKVRKLIDHLQKG